MAEEYSKYKLYRKYKTEDGVNYTPLDEYQAVYESGDGVDCSCGYREYEWRLSNPPEYICGSVLNGDYPILTISKVEGNWTREGNTFTSNDINDGETTVQRIYFNLSKPSLLKFTIDQSSESYGDYLIIGNLDKIVTNTTPTGSSYNYYSHKNKTTGTTSMTISDNSEHFIELMYRKDSRVSNGRDNVIVTLDASIVLDYDSTSKYEILRKWEMCPYDESYDVLTDDVIYVNPQKSYDCNWVTYKWEVIDGEYICAESDVISFKTSNINNTLIEMFINQTTKKIPINDGIAYVNILKDLSIEKLTACTQTFPSSITELLTFPDTSNVTKMTSMFENCSNLKSLDVTSFDTSNVTSMSSMFSGCNNLTELDLSSFDTSNVTTMAAMFSYCSGLTELDLSSFDTSKVTKMYEMFYQCSGLTSLDLSSFDTSNVTDMSKMFRDCRSLTSLVVSNFNTSNVNYMYEMFMDCTSLISLDVSNFDTSNISNMSFMFYRCNKLQSLNVSGWDISKVSYQNSTILYGCTSLKSLILGDVTQEQYDWWYARLTEAGIQDNVTITYNLID